MGDFNVKLPEDKQNEAISRITSKIEETDYKSHENHKEGILA